MFHFLRGRVSEILPGLLVLDCGGIGYEINIPQNSRDLLASPGDELTVYTAMIVKEDDVSLYGFSDRESLAMFRMLMGVSGVGPKAALAVLSALSTRELKQALVYEDAASIATANGVGKKTAQRIVLELKDKVSAADIPAGPAAPAVKGKSSAKDDAVMALVSLGFTRSEAMSAVTAIDADDLSAEEYIRLALRSR